MENAGSAPMLRLTCALNSAKRPHLSHRQALWVVLTLLGSFLFGCSSSSDHAPSLGAGDAGTTKPPPMVGACETPAQGCDCETQGEVVDCGQVERVSGDYVSCAMGRRTCDDGKWGACVGDSIATMRLPAGSKRTQALGTGMTCPDNPCDPYCRVVLDSPTDLPLPDGGAFTADGGLQVVPREQVGGQGACTSMIVKPTPQSLTVTSVAARGVLGEYFDRVDEDAPQISTAWVPTATRVEPNIDFGSGLGETGVAGINGQNFSVRWTGTITAPSAGSYTLCVQSDDGNRVWIDGALISDLWEVHSTHENCSAALNWAAGSSHSVRYEFFQIAGNTLAQLTWQSATIAKQAIPQSAYGVIGGAGPMVSGRAKFSVEVSPANCFPGTPSPAWTLDRLDVATIDSTGLVGLIAPVAGPITVTAYLGTLTATGVVDVTVDVANNDAAPTGSVTKFQGTASGTDSARVLYPYDQTVFPLGLRAPRIQWDNTGAAASAVKVTVRYPSSGAPAFRWSQIIPESNPPQATIPGEIWNYLGQTAKGQAASFSVQRVIGGTLRPAQTRTLNFSSAPIRGKIYYTQYHRGGDPSEMVADPGSESPARPAFASADNCPVCHTLSANGNVFATTSKVGYYNNNYTSPITFSPTLGGISSVNGDGSLTPIADFVGTPERANYTGGSSDWRGFAWAPLTPDGKYALVANNFWGNTNQALVGINPATRQVSVGSAMLSGGSGTGLLAQYYPSTDYSGTAWKRIDPQLNFNFGAAAPGGLLPADFSVKRVGQIQAYFSETYKFEVVSSSSDSFALTVAGTTVSGAGPTSLIANVALTAGALVPFELDQINASGNSNVQVYWSSPSTPRALIPQSQLYPPASEPAHGANVTYANGSGTGSVSRIEPDIASDWGSHNPVSGIGVDNWTSTWDAQVESPYTGPVSLCVDSDDGVVLSVNGTTLINSAASYNNCAAAQDWIAGAKYPIHLVHTEGADNARLILKYRYGATPVTEVIPSTNLYPVSPPSTLSGLTATYYDLGDFNVSVPATQSNPRAFQRIDPNIDFDFVSGRPNYSIISSDDYFSARWTGQITLACDGMYQFRSSGNVEGGRLWIDEARVMGRWTAGTLVGAGQFSAGTHDFKFDWYDTTGNAVAKLEWQTPCAGSPGWVTIPPEAFTPSSSYTRTTGYVIDGGENGNGSSYWVWQLPTTAAPAPVDVTADSPGNWGLAGTTMMVPSFSPDGRKLVFIDGDSGGGAGWRKGLSTLDFDQTQKRFSNRRLVTSTWPFGDALKWPTFETDSRSVIFQSTVPGDYCCRNTWTKYGYMGPTNYSEDPGRLWSVDTTAATPTPVALTKLNSGEQAKDANKSYQPTMLPSAAGGYRWVVFTSTRPYGNSANLPAVQQDFSNTASYASSSYTAMTNSDDIQSQLWVAAIDDAGSAATDRSHPAFWLPNQNFSASAATGYINERGYWVLDACHAAGNDAAASCEVDEDCCGGTASPKTAACRLDIPLTTPPRRHCHSLPAPGECIASAGACGSTAECCSGLVCVGAQCQTPPAVLAVGAENYERIYHSDCPDGTKVVWRFFDWQTVTPATDSKLEIFAETQADPKNFAILPVAPNAVTGSGIVHVGTVTGPPVTVWTGNAVDLLLEAQMLKSQEYLKVTVRFVPNSERTASPILKDWRQSYSCVPAE